MRVTQSKLGRLEVEGLGFCPRCDHSQSKAPDNPCPKCGAMLLSIPTAERLGYFQIVPSRRPKPGPDPRLEYDPDHPTRGYDYFHEVQS